MLSKKHIINKRYYFVIFLLLITHLFSSCAYYNYFYNAKKYYNDGEKQRKETTDDSDRRSTRGSSNYDKCIESAGRMLEYYPDNRWEDDALLLLAKAYYRTENYRKAIGKIDELIAKYPKSEFIQEGKLWKGISLLKVSQPDSGRLILSELSGDDVPVEIRAQSYLALGEFYHEDERWEEARIEFRKVLDSGVKDEYLKGIAWVMIGECLTKLDKPEEAVKLYEEILCSKPNRRLKLEATTKRALVLMRLNRTEVALKSLEELLHDAAYVNDFPQIEMIVARCLIALRKYEDAQKKLQNLIDTERRGELAAEANYEMGWLLWEQWHDFPNAYKSFVEVKSADRTSPFSTVADSLKNEMETLYGSWQKLIFLENQIIIADSSISGLRVMVEADTVFTDSLKLVTEADKKKSNRSRDTKRKRKDRRKEEELISDKEEIAEGDSTVAEDETVVAEFDSTLLVSLISQRRTEQIIARMELAGFHFFQRNDPDSAVYYYNMVANLDTVNEIWGRAVAALAFIAGNRDDGFKRDSLYKLLYEKMPETDFSRYASKALGMQVETQETDSLYQRFIKTENLWWKSDNQVEARDEYLRIAEIADSASDIRAKALLAAAYLSRKVIKDDSLALALYTTIAEEYKDTEAGRLAARRIDKNRIKQNQDEVVKGNEQMEIDGTESNLTGVGDFRRDFTMDDGIEDDRIYEPDEVDELPRLLTNSRKLQGYISQYYPEEISGENITSRVEINFIVQPSSEISEVEIAFIDRPGQGFEDAALEVMKHLKYTAGKRMGKKVRIRMKQVLIFEEEEEGAGEIDKFDKPEMWKNGK
ncbi:tetratricopeptide repeat protein [bacterium]|nr:tetratricopeptide repeat protein [bacterium]